MVMYGVLNKELELVAYHEREKVVKTYINYIHMHSDDVLNIKKIKHIDDEFILKYSDLYLVKYGETYVQEGYLDYMDIAVLDDDAEYALDVIDRIIRTAKLSDKQIKTLKKSINILSELVEEGNTYVPTLNQLKRIKMDYDPYIYNTKGCE